MRATENIQPPCNNYHILTTYTYDVIAKIEHLLIPKEQDKLLNVQMDNYTFFYV